MIHHIYHSVIPNKKNRFKPHILKHEVLVIAFLLLYGFQINYNMANGSGRLLGYATNINVSQLNSLSNSERTSRGLPALTLNSQLNNAATAKANDMIAKNYWAHTSPSGKEPWAFISEAGYSYSYAGENLAYGFSTSSGTVQGWMDSPGHKANILNTNYSQVGYAVVNGSNYQGGENTVVVAMYAYPYGASAPSSTPEPASTSIPAPQPAVQSAPVTTPEPQIIVKEEPTPERDVEVCRDGEVITVTESNIIESDVDPPCPVPEPETDVDAIAQNVESAPPSAETSPINSGNVLGSLTAPAVASAGFLSMAVMASGLRHIHFWQHHKPRHMLHWLHKHPVFQTLALVAGLLTVLASGSGFVG